MLVCMTLASRHRPMPILLGALTAFALLNLLAVLFGAAVANWLPEYLLSLIVAALFALFAWHALSQNADAEENDEIKETGSHTLFITALLMIFVAEFGDKTQIAVAGLASTLNVSAVWFGATLALGITSALGIWAGRTVIQRIPLHRIHQLSGVLFIILALTSLYHGLNIYIHP